MALRYVQVPDAFALALPANFFEKLALEQAEKMAREKYYEAQKLASFTDDFGNFIVHPYMLTAAGVEVLAQRIEQAGRVLRELRRMADALEHERERLAPESEPQPEPELAEAVTE